MSFEFDPREIGYRTSEEAVYSHEQPNDAMTYHSAEEFAERTTRYHMCQSPSQRSTIPLMSSE